MSSPERSPPGEVDFDSRDGVVPDLPEGQDPVFFPEQVDLDGVIQDRVPGAGVVADLGLGEPHPGDVLGKADLTIKSLWKKSRYL